MSDRKKFMSALAALAVLALVATSTLALSIEAEPVKVTHRNSGPRYDITADNEVERTKMTGDEQEQPQLPPMMRPLEGPASSRPAGEDQPTPIGHVAIRRIYLFPVMSRGDWSAGDSSPQEAGSEQSRRPQQPQDGEQEQAMPSMFAKPFWPFLTPARPPPSARGHSEGPVHRPHLFGADEASRSPASAGDQDRAASGGEREEPMMMHSHRHHEHDHRHPMAGSPAQGQQQPLFDPIQMMLDMMHQAIQAQMVPPSSETNKNDKSQGNNNNNNDNSPSESATSNERPRPFMPGTELAGLPKPAGQNETREEIVEIEGKKYLRKIIVNRHIGENLIFMTKRLIFVPLNETTDDATATTTTTSPEVPVATGVPAAATTMTSAAQDESTSSSVIPDRVGDNKPTTTTVLSTSPESTTTTESPASTAAASTEEAVTMGAKDPEPVSTSVSSEQPAVTSTAATAESTPAESATTSKSTESFVDRVSDAIEKAAERLVEEVKSTTSTQAPAVTTSDKPQ